MKRNLKKRIFFVLLIVLIAIGSIVFAGGTGARSAETTIKTIFINIINVVAWFGYAIAVGTLIFVGIKYVMSGANERAQIKGMLPKYLIGIALIVCCSSIAQIVVNIAGNDDAEKVINTGTNL